MIRVILMDIDNTILDFDAFVRSSMEAGFAHFGLPAFGEDMLPVFHRVNDLLWDGIEKGELTIEDVHRNRWNMIFLTLGIDFDGPAFEAWFRAYLHECAILVEDAGKIIPYLAERYLLCAASNGPYEQQVHRMELAGMGRYFSGMYISERAGASKPSAAFFDYCMEDLARIARDRGEAPYRKEEILMIGDSMTADMRGAAGYGLKTCFFDRKKTGTQGQPVTYHVESLSELEKLL